MSFIDTGGRSPRSRTAVLNMAISSELAPILPRGLFGMPRKSGTKARSVSSGRPT